MGAISLLALELSVLSLARFACRRPDDCCIKLYILAVDFSLA